MPGHEFKIGQVVNFTALEVGVSTSLSNYTISRLLLDEGGEHQYRIKTITESLARVVKESEIVLGPKASERRTVLQFFQRQH